LSAKENILLGLSGTGLTRREAQQQADQALALCTIDTLADRTPSTLSGGEQQRVALARAIARRPTYLFLDEPFSGLDLVTKHSVLESVATLANDGHMTVVLVTHDPRDAGRLCSRAVVLGAGRVEESGLLGDLFRAPQSETLKVALSTYSH
jgi:ABC-type nitrate/sulfonate/bicarbonate transport system ATPase subunit